MIGPILLIKIDIYIYIPEEDFHIAPDKTTSTLDKACYYPDLTMSNILLHSLHMPYWSNRECLHTRIQDIPIQGHNMFMFRYCIPLIRYYLSHNEYGIPLLNTCSVLVIPVDPMRRAMYPHIAWPTYGLVITRDI